MSSGNNYRQEAQNAYRAFQSIFTTAGNVFWRLGHAFDTGLDYHFYVHGSDGLDFLKDALGQFASIDTKGDWYDDFGWWGIAAQKASVLRTIPPDLRLACGAVVKDCWQQMYGNARFGWASATQPYKDTYVPRYEGGVWNHVMDQNDNPSLWTPATANLAGRQNSVTNGLYLVLASRLAQENDAPIVYRTEWEAEWNFLSQWYDDASDPLLWRYSPSTTSQPSAVIRERVGGFLNRDVKDAGYRDDLAWTGDQGLMLGGLVERMRLVGSQSPDYPRLLEAAKSILSGTRERLSGISPSGTSVLKPWHPDPSPGPDDDDYWTGLAVFMRYLLKAWENEDLKSWMQQNHYPDFIASSADCAVNPHGNYSGSSDALVNATNVLATLVTAAVIVA